MKRASPLFLVVLALSAPPLPPASARAEDARTAETAEPIYQREHELLVDAIRTGRAEGRLTGPIATLFAHRFRTGGALHAIARVIGPLARPDCKRLELTYTQSEVPGRSGPQEVALRLRLNYCLDGRPPDGAEPPP